MEDTEARVGVAIIVGDTKTMTPPKLLPPHYFALSLILIVLTKFTGVGDLFGGWLPYLGIAAMLIALPIGLHASRQFAKADTDIIPFAKSTTLVTDGMFQWSRNPMYMAMICFLAGLAWLVDNLPGWLVVLAFAILIRQRFVLNEEVLMLETFGDAYREYQQRVRRWL